MQRQTRKAKVKAASASNPCESSVREVERNEEFAVLPVRSYRSIVLSAINESTTWSTAHDLARQTRLTYPQVVFALHALHNNEQIARAGRKFTARWGALALVNEPTHNFQLLEQLFHGIVNSN